MEDVLLVLFFLLKIFTLYFAAVACFALLRRKRYPVTAPKTRFAVVIAARNEEAVIANLVRDVLSQDYPPYLRDVYVVPNNCTDKTEAAALAAGAEIIHCLNTVHSKGDALHGAFLQLADCGYDAFLVLDADNTLRPDYLSRMNDAFAAGAMVCKSRTKAANPGASGVAGCYGLYNTCFDLIWNRPRAACGLSAKLVGTGFAFRREVLEKLGGWNTATIAEDAEFAAQCAGAGYRVWWVPEAVNLDEEPTDFGVSLRQRRRWCSGVMQVGKRELGGLWGRGCVNARLRWDMTMFLLAPFTGAISSLLLVLRVVLAAGDVSALALAGASLALYGLGCMGLGVVLTYLGGYTMKEMRRAVVVFPLFMASWLPLQVLSLFKDAKSWQAIVHTGASVVQPGNR